jgi:alpha-galactosidase
MLSMIFVLFLSLCFTMHACSALDNGLAVTAPPMGVSTWSVFRGEIHHQLIVDLADNMIRLGLKNAGYTYLLMDAGWATDKPGCAACMAKRNATGHLFVDPDKFPDLKATIDHVHSKGLLFGIWFGFEMCDHTNDNANFEEYVDYAELDAQFFASMGVDAVKHDICNLVVPNTTEGIAHNFDKYERMSQALNQTGRSILYDVTLMVSKPRTMPAYDYNYIWSPEPYGRNNVQRIANTWWSVPLNKYNCWICCVHPQEYLVPESDCENPHKLAAWRGLLPMLDVQDMGTPGWKGHWDWAGKGNGWNHLDQLSVCVGKSWYGRGLTPSEQRAQISLWAIMASPMIVSVDTRDMAEGDFCHSLISNSRLIQVHQDPLGLPGHRLKNNYGSTHDSVIESQIWTRPLQGGGAAVVFFNRSEKQRSITATFDEVGLSSIRKTAAATNVWTNVVSNVTSPLTVKVEPHGVSFLTLMPDRYSNDELVLYSSLRRRLQ